MRVPYNEKTHHIYATLARISREIAAREETERREQRNPDDKTGHAA